jgi:hypothetical protein
MVHKLGLWTITTPHQCVPKEYHTSIEYRYVPDTGTPPKMEYSCFIGWSEVEFFAILNSSVLVEVKLVYFSSLENRDGLGIGIIWYTI